jgi:hypothetical protein
VPGNPHEIRVILFSQWLKGFEARKAYAKAKTRPKYGFLVV